jgi:hypothetical protein
MAPQSAVTASMTVAKPPMGPCMGLSTEMAVQLLCLGSTWSNGFCNKLMEGCVRPASTSRGKSHGSHQGGILILEQLSYNGSVSLITVQHDLSKNDNQTHQRKLQNYSG